MPGLLGLPPIVNLVISLAILAYLVYHTVTTGVQPLSIVFFVLALFSLTRVLFRLGRRTHVEEND